MAPVASWVALHPRRDHIESDRTTLAALTACLLKKINIGVPSFIYEAEVSYDTLAITDLKGVDLEKGTSRL
jgi:hypothetical protein